MKTLIFTLLMLIYILAVRAQQTPRLPNNKLPLSPYSLKPDSNFNKLFKGNTDSLVSNRIIAGLNSNRPRATKIDRMPVVRLNNTDPNMLIVQPDKTGYTMPVAGINQPPIYYMKKPGAKVKPLP
ncbi:hypothetical protein [Mucilaginibacter sp.]|uniref:hypothetical protein n=1 Tax=Mucilaginibacter sp. TaxID=1882438 RepID=UPI00262E7457|nr:hypothetical protein [Mucilaginibacter sp.]MDB5032083.1 hypothetical protein [Mucilaginibacter sp.]